MDKPQSAITSKEESSEVLHKESSTVVKNKKTSPKKKVKSAVVRSASASTSDSSSTSVVITPASASTIGQEIWSKIKDRPIQMFGLPAKRIVDYCTFVPMDPTKCFLSYKITSVLPVVEDAVKDYQFETVGKYMVLSLKR